MKQAILEHHCGARIEAGAAWCFECNSEVVFASTGVDTSGRPAERPAPVDAPSSAGVRPCTEDCAGCGRPLETGATSCEFCGVGAAPARVSLPGGLTLAIGPDDLFLGRLSDDDRVGEALDVDEVSRRHASLSFDGTAVWLEDLGSTNGTWLAGRRLATRVRLPSGDVEIGLGRRLTVTVHVP